VTVNAAMGDPKADDWQLRRLMQPTQQERLAERHGRVMVYNGLTDRQVGKAMNQHVSRIESMMFTGTVITDEPGVPMRIRQTVRS